MTSGDSRDCRQGILNFCVRCTQSDNPSRILTASCTTGTAIASILQQFRPVPGHSSYNKQCSNAAADYRCDRSQKSGYHSGFKATQFVGCSNKERVQRGNT